MKRRTQVELMDRLLEELEPADLEVVHMQYIPERLNSILDTIEKRNNEVCFYHGWSDSCKTYMSNMDSFMLGYMLGKREQRMKNKVLKELAPTF